jgi:hypothetical protein
LRAHDSSACPSRIYGTRVPFRIAQNHHRTVSKY